MAFRCHRPAQDCAFATGLRDVVLTVKSATAAHLCGVRRSSRVMQ
jgi:hypothetical protein